MLELLSESVAPTGSISAAGVRNAIGRPDMDLWTLFARETLQNSIDAKRRDLASPLHFSIDIRELDDQQHETLLNEVLVEIPADGEDDWGRLRTDRTVAIVSDRGTDGLGGPLRADESSKEHTDFADFVWNVGQPPDKKLGGGTYGYGKGVLYRASAVGTVVIHTRCLTADGIESRLIACALGEPFAAAVDGRTSRHTGRHWWGVRSESAPFGPLIGAEADRVAAELGMPGYDDATGTSIMVLCARTNDADDSDPAEQRRETAAAIADALFWFGWPVLIGRGDGPVAALSVSVNGESLAIPDPASHPEIRHLVASLRNALTAGDESREIRVTRPPVLTGRLALRRHPDNQEDSNGRPIEGPLHHVALMRHPLTVVHYLPGPPSAEPRSAWSGVFIADDAVDRAFAGSEPPAHDEWVPRAVVDKAQRRIVNVTLRRIREEMRELVQPAAQEATGESAPLGRLSDSLGSLLPSTMGTSVAVLGGCAGEASTGAGSRGRRAKSDVRVTGQRLVIEGGRRILRVGLEPSFAEDADGLTVRVAVDVATNEGAGVEGEPPLGSSSPRLIGYENGGGRVEQPSIEIARDDVGPLEALIELPEDVAVVVRPRIEELS